MAKKKISLFECQHCGEQSTKWLGKCPNCGSWDSFIELNQEQQEVLKNSSKIINITSKAKPITQIEQDDVTRFSSYNYEFDLVLGGGIVPGSLTLIGGSPGVGKSTLLLKVAGSISKSGKKVLYVSGEESAEQIKLRADRLGINNEDILFLGETDIDIVNQAIINVNPKLVIIDSIQTMYSDEITAAAGSVSQVREITRTSYESM